MASLGARKGSGRGREVSPRRANMGACSLVPSGSGGWVVGLWVGGSHSDGWRYRGDSGREDVGEGDSMVAGIAGCRGLVGGVLGVTVLIKSLQLSGAKPGLQELE